MGKKSYLFKECMKTNSAKKKLQENPLKYIIVPNLKKYKKTSSQ
jgi:hypothetical protein